MWQKWSLKLVRGITVGIYVAPNPVLLGMDFLIHHNYHLDTDGSLVLYRRTVQCEVRVLAGRMESPV